MRQSLREAPLLPLPRLSCSPPPLPAASPEFPLSAAGSISPPSPAAWPWTDGTFQPLLPSFSSPQVLASCRSSAWMAGSQRSLRATRAAAPRAPGAAEGSEPGGTGCGGHGAGCSSPCCPKPGTDKQPLHSHVVVSGGQQKIS